MSDKIYEVLECDGVSGLTVGSHSLKPGRKFSERDWPYGQEALDNAVKKKRCKLISEENKEKKKSDKSKDDDKSKSKGDDK